MTAKGLQYRIDLLHDQRKKLEVRMFKIMDSIQSLMSSHVNCNVAAEQLDQFDDVYKLFEEVHNSYQLLCEGDQEYDRAADDDYFAEIDETVFVFKHKARNWVKEMEQYGKRKSNSSSEDSKSYKSKQSGVSSKGSIKSRTSIAERAIEEKIKLAELIAEATFLDKRHEAERLAGRLKLEEEMAKTQARAKIYEEFESASSGSDLDENGDKEDNNRLKFRCDKEINHDDVKLGTRLPPAHKVSKKVTYPTPVAKRDEKPAINEISDMFCKLLQHQSAPDVDIESFDGNPLNYHYFVTMFSDVIEKNIQDPRGSLTRLIKFTNGEAKQLIQHCIQLPLEIGYQKARSLLKQKYGDPYTIIAAYRQEIKEWPILKGGDASAFRKFHNLLIKCQNLSTTLEWNALDNPDTICNRLTKLPVYLRDKWNRKVFVIRKSFREPTFCDFVEFIDDESTLVCDPLFSRNAIDKFSGTEYKKKKLKNFVIKSSNSRLSGGDYRNKEAVKCHLCDGYHDLDDCDEYLKTPVEERSKFLAQKKLCYGCYDQINANHKARNCTKRRRCKNMSEESPKWASWL